MRGSAAAGRTSTRPPSAAWFHPEDRIIVNPLRVKDWILSEMETSRILFDSGVSRSSAQIIAEQSNNLAENRGDTLEAMHVIKQDAFRTKEYLSKGEFNGFAKCMHKA